MLVDYGSGSDTDNDTDSETTPPPSASKPSTPLPSSQKSTFLLPPPTNGASSASKLSATILAPKSKKPAKKIAINMPSVSKDDADADDLDAARPVKKARVDTKGAGSSALFSMLPAPKQKLPVAPAPQRVLGGGGNPGLVFHTSPGQSIERPSAIERNLEDQYLTTEQTVRASTLSQPFMPPSLIRNKANIYLEEPRTRSIGQPTSKFPSSAAPDVDFFSLESSSISSSSKARVSNLPKVSSAPKVEDYVPPEPTPTDEYPGYYKLPSGTWEAYDPDYYQKFYNKWKADYDAQVRALEKGLEKGFEGADADETQEVNALKEMERAKKETQEREEKKALTQDSGASPVAPRMNIKGSKLGKGARTRHQLTTLLADAYENREALEAKIAEGRRNRKEAGNKYGF